MTERFFKSLREECVWQHSIRSFDEACTTICRWIRFFNEHRPHHRP